jgi:G:T-mismatch repair DNA endonuclease (very short patch repair protein)
MKKTIMRSFIAISAIMFSYQGNAYEGNPDIVIKDAKNKFFARGCKTKEGHWCVIKGGHPDVPETITFSF